ncbi:DUF262 domain-containing protein [Geodermatophilus aquaeductus]|uniref:GmrSD restriction endonucleases N-terminal domain-containing protein n=1 Tax=Geodermatophilus aquaeductus TaxID=1564161 RepID=A0A521EYW3_9ACTN|nr:DUF262 domain-containing protein [Geodermatophilus aquaeductus]SMO89212.1 Protein of unknown function DUF262 [Geodermatophilus aquaeductus]
MAFQTPVTVQEVLAGIHEKRYLLPAIQREFVWGTDQIRQLVDSLMRGYPIGSFLLWNVEPDTASHYAFYDFLTDFHERDHPYATKATVPSGRSAVAILDGQQRLTSLNIAVYGSHAEKKKYAWWNSPDAFPRKRLYLNLLEDPDHEELSLRYDLRFLTDSEAQPQPGEPAKWFRVGDVLKLENSGPALMKALKDRGVDLNEVDAHQRLYDLYEAIRVTKPINYYLEGSQDPDKVLDIFVRVNSGGTTLSYSDLLLSMATNQWEEYDAREEVRALVQELNTGGSREFSFSKDVVLKTALMVAGVDLRFRVTNFTQDNMKKVEKVWSTTRAALLRAATLLSRFGLSTRSLTAHSVVIPIAYLLASKGLDDSYLDSTASAEDRVRLQKWVNRSLMKRGIWGSGLDTTLSRIRQAIDAHGASGFPVEAVQAEMAAIGKSLEFEATEVDELLELKYGGQRTFPVLAMLYPGLDLSKVFHEDHVFPRSRFTRKRLAEAGVAVPDIDVFVAAVDRLPNLQLLQGQANVEKQAVLPAKWLDKAFVSEEQRATYVEQNDLDVLPEDIKEFMDFYEARKACLRDRLQQRLGVKASTAADTP